jgi:hypothetical protein
MHCAEGRSWSSSAISLRRQGKLWTPFAMSPGLDLAAGAVAGALVGQPGPPVLIYLLQIDSL